MYEVWIPGERLGETQGISYFQGWGVLMIKTLNFGPWRLYVELYNHREMLKRKRDHFGP